MGIERKDMKSFRIYSAGKRSYPALFGLTAFVVYLAYATMPRIGEGCCPFEDATPNRVRADLQTVRSMLQLYEIQHGGEYPPSEKFVECMTKPTMPDHALCDKDTDGKVGPYLQQIPLNPYNELSTVGIAGEDSEIGDGSHGWHYNETTGEFNIDWIGEEGREHFNGLP